MPGNSRCTKDAWILSYLNNSNLSNCQYSAIGEPRSQLDSVVEATAENCNNANFDGAIFCEEK